MLLAANHKSKLYTVAPSYKATLTIAIGHPSYQVRFSMHWDSKMLLTCICPQERSPLFLI